MGLMGNTLSREECASAAWAGILTYGLIQPITVAGPWPMFAAFPLFPCLQIVEASLFSRSTACQPEAALTLNGVGKWSSRKVLVR